MRERASARTIGRIAMKSLRTHYVRLAFPNITGVTAPVPDISGNISGAFSLGNYLYKTISDGTHFSMYDMKFTASASNSTYSGSSVQPAALQTLIIIKV